MSIIKDSYNIIDDKINKMFEKEERNNNDVLFKIFNLVLYKNARNTDMIDLYKNFSISDFVKIISIFDGKIVKFYSLNEIRETLLLTLTYYYREIMEYTWEEIKQMVPFEINTIKYGIQIKNLNSYLKQKINEIFNNKKKEKL